MGFLIQWLCYLIAFVAGSAVACVIANVMMKRNAERQAPADARAPGVGGER